MDPQQELFSYFLVELKKIYRDMVFDGYMPPENTPYPFIYIADSQQTDDLGNKTAIFNDVYQTIHIWNDTPKKEGLSQKWHIQLSNWQEALNIRVIISGM